MKYQRYAVIGCNSYAGGAFVAKALERGAQVIGFNRSLESNPIFAQYRKIVSQGEYRFIQADINFDLDHIMRELDEFCPQVVVDFAGQGMVAESWQAPEQWYTTNIVSKVKLHDQLRKRKWLERYIRISTPEVYGSQESLLKEVWQYNPSSPYAVSHAAIDMSLRAFHHQYGFPVVFSRFANFYGPGQQLYRIVPRTIIYALLGRKFQLHGGGTSVRAFIFGDDVADAVFRLAEAGVVGELYHFSPEKFLTIRQVVEIICQQLGVAFSDIAEVGPERPSKDQAYLMDASKARNILGWRESVTFEQGVDQTNQWVKASLTEIKGLPLNYIYKP
jgi:dTDP-glucose 4,6-dehydratase